MTLSALAGPASRLVFALEATVEVYEGRPIRCVFRGTNREGIKWVDVIEGDMQATMDAAEFVAMFPTRPEPRRMDKLVVDGKTWTVQAWHAANAPQPVFFRVLLRGGPL